jgi:hypothetical protein
MKKPHPAWGETALNAIRARVLKQHKLLQQATLSSLDTNENTGNLCRQKVTKKNGVEITELRT